MTSTFADKKFKFFFTLIFKVLKVISIIYVRVTKDMIRTHKMLNDKNSIWSKYVLYNNQYVCICKGLVLIFLIKLLWLLLYRVIIENMSLIFILLEYKFAIINKSVLQFINTNT